MTEGPCQQERKELEEAKHERDRAQQDYRRFLATTPLDRVQHAQGFSLDEITLASERLKKAEAAVKEKEGALRECG
jgi:hypothetical protein